MAEESAQTVYVSPQQLIQKAQELVPQGNIGIAFTYNEPLISYEYVRDCSMFAREQGLKIVLVTNGTICREPLLELLPYINAMNIDLKGFTQRFYKMISGDLEIVKETIALAAKSCHTEVTTLIIPDENDSEHEMEALSAWLASISPEIPLHISRFFPQYKMQGKAPTPVETIFRLREIAEKYLTYVYVGNC
jgi:pyruvate formate lyase activating enzyme